MYVCIYIYKQDEFVNVNNVSLIQFLCTVIIFWKKIEIRIWCTVGDKFFKHFIKNEFNYNFKMMSVIFLV